MIEPHPTGADMNDPQGSQELGRRAERVGASRGALQQAGLERASEVLQELQSPQIELELQNASRQPADGESEVSGDPYAELHDLAPVCYLTLDEQGVIRHLNVPARGLLGHERNHLLGHPLILLAAPRVRNDFMEYLRQCRELSDGQQLDLETIFRGREREEVAVHLRTLASRHQTTGHREYRTGVLEKSEPRAGDAAQRMIGVSFDVTQRQRAEVELTTLNETLEQRVVERTSDLAMLRDIASMAHRAHDVEDTLRYCLRRIVEHNGWCFGHIYLPSATDSDLLLPSYACYAADVQRFEDYRALTLKTLARRGEGLVGQVLESGRPVWSSNLHAELGVRRAELARRLGLTTAAAFPVSSEDRVVGVLEFFSHERIEPGAGLLESLAGVGLQLGRVIGRKAFQDRLLTLSEVEHRRIGQELHDDVGQEMTGLALKAETLAEMLREQQHGALHELAQKLVTAIDRTRGKIQALSRGLVPMEIDAPALAAALENLARQTNEAKIISCHFHCHGDARVTDSQTATQLYRIAQEAVANALRHSRAGQLDIMLTTDASATLLQIRDDGDGLTMNLPDGKGLGVQIMRYRAGLIDGTLTIESLPAGGTQVTCRLANRREVEQGQMSEGLWVHDSL